MNSITGKMPVSTKRSILIYSRYDCLAGAIIGSVMATSAYRMVYASVWDFRFNHIPLTRHTPFSYGAGEAGAGGFESAVFTRRAGWGYDEAYGGAPFDAAHHLRGQMNGFNAAATKHEGILGRKRNDVEHNAGTGYTQQSIHNPVGVGGYAQQSVHNANGMTGSYESRHHQVHGGVHRKAVPGTENYRNSTAL